MRRVKLNHGSFLVTKTLFFVSVSSVIVLSLLPSMFSQIAKTKHTEDISIAEHMTEIISETRDPIFSTSYDSYDIQSMIDDGHYDTYDSMVQLDHNELFYVNQLDRVIVLPCDDMFAHVSMIFESYGIPYPDNEQPIYVSPEEFLGKGIHHLPNEGSIITDTIKFIRSYPNSSSKSYETYMNDVKAQQKHFVHRLLFSDAVSQEIDVSLSLLEYYDPTKTLWVDNDSWYTEATSSGDVHAILFEKGILNIPSFDMESRIDFSEGKIVFEEVILPKTLKNIEKASFSKLYFEINQLTIKSISGLYVQKGAVDGVTTFSRDIAFFRMDLLDLTEYFKFSMDENEDVSFGLGDNSKVIADYGITAYKMEQFNDIVVVYLYTFDFLVAYATNAYVLDFYLDGQQYPYVTLIQTNDQYIDPIEPESTTQEFVGWFDHDDNRMISNETELSSNHTSLYAKWVDPFSS